MRIKQSDLDAYIAASAVQKRPKVESYRVALSDRDTLVAPLPTDPTPDVSVYEVEAPSPDQAVARATRQWHAEVDEDSVAPTVSVSLLD